MSSITTGLTQEMSTYYDKRFLERAQEMVRYDAGASKKSLQRNEGKTVNFTRRTPLAKATTPLTEATNPSAVDMTSTTVSAVLAPYGNWTKVGQLYSLTSIDVGLREHVDVHAQNAAETIDELIANELDGGGTSAIANTVAATSSIATSDTIDGADVRAQVRTLKLNKAPAFSGGGIRANHYGAIIPVSVVHDLRGDSEWLDAYRYVENEPIKNGTAGFLHGVQFVETNNEVLTADAGSGNVDVYKTFFFGQDSYATVMLEGQDGPRIYVKTPGANSTDNPLELFSTIGWQANFVAKVLNSDWVIEFESASSVGSNS